MSARRALYRLMNATAIESDPGLFTTPVSWRARNSSRRTPQRSQKRLAKEDDSTKHWILNVLPNMKEVGVEERLREFRPRNDNGRMSPPVCRAPMSSFIGYLKLVT